MIVRMKKMMVACRAADRDRLLRLAKRLAIVHLIPCRPMPAGALAHIDQQISILSASIQIAQQHGRPDSHEEDIGALEASAVAFELVALQKEARFLETEIKKLSASLETHEAFGNVEQADIARLSLHNVSVSFWQMNHRDINELPPDTYEVLQSPASTHQVTVALFEKLAAMPKGAKRLPVPSMRASEVRAQLSRHTARLNAVGEKMTKLSGSARRLENRLLSWYNLRNWKNAADEAASTEQLFVLQGWIPSRAQREIEDAFHIAAFEVGIAFYSPNANETPPTLWTPPRFARPINALFRILGTTPGYTENDVSPGFIVALPLFCALLIADGGYGFLILLAAILGLYWANTAAKKEAAQLLLIIGVAAMIWGIMIASVFGFNMDDLERNVGCFSGVCYMLSSIRIIEGDLSDSETVNFLMALSFVLGAVHMSVARIWRAGHVWPHPEAISHVGWAVVIWGVLLLTNTLVLDAPTHYLMTPLLIGGALLIVMFSTPEKRGGSRILFGFASLPLGALSVMSDTISYIRLMAVGLASSILGGTFNLLAAQVSEGASPLLGALVFLFGHGLNIGLAMIALFAHGVRLNMLEFSNHLGMGWAGYVYAPFKTLRKEK